MSSDATSTMVADAGRTDDDLLAATGARKEFGGLVATNDVDFFIPRQKIVSLIGPNGAGKTTFFNMLTGVYSPTSGVIMFDGESIVGKPPHAITRRASGGPSRTSACSAR